MTEYAYISSLVANARQALAVYETFTQEKVDACIKAMCLAFRTHAKVLADEAVEETGYGCAETKLEKNEQAADAIWYTLKNEPSVGIIGEDREKKLIYVAKPIGVIAAVTPSTNPSTTILFNACYALKGRNTVIFSTHPGAPKTSFHTIHVLQEALRQSGAPEHVLQYVDAGELNLTDELLGQCDLSIIAGPAKVVQKGYSSGHPCIGVSHGNVQTIVDRGYDYDQAVRESVYSGSFDNGLICACTQAVIVPTEARTEVLDLFRRYGALVLTQPEEINQLRSLLFPDNEHFDRNYLGKAACVLAQDAGFTAGQLPKILLAAPEAFADDDPLLRGEMSPVCLLLTYDTFEDALELAKRGLSKDGAGHSTVIYTHDEEKARRMALALPITRLLVNQPSVYAANQQLHNGLTPTSNLSCGSWANNSFSENISFRHMLNVCRISWELDQLPDTSDLWA